MAVPGTPVAAVMIHVADALAGLAWYRRAFPRAVLVVVEGNFQCLELDGVKIEIVPADAKVAAGAAGSVVYWFTDDFEKRKAFLESIGAVLYRGPIDIEDGWRMCQLKDPFGNLLGIRGPRRRDAPESQNP